MGKLTPELVAALVQCVHRWQQHAAVSTVHCHRHSHRHQHPTGTALSPQSHQCSTEKVDVHKYEIYVHMSAKGCADRTHNKHRKCTVGLEKKRRTKSTI